MGRSERRPWRPLALILVIGGLLAASLPGRGQARLEELERRLESATGAERVGALTELATALKDEDPERGVHLADEAVALAGTLGDATGEARGHLARGENLNILGRNDDAFAAYEAALDRFEAIGDRKSQAATLRRIGVSYFDLGELDTALERYLQSLRIAEELGDSEEIAKTSANIGNVHWATGRLDQAASYQDRALAAFETSGNRVGVAGTSINLAAIHSAMASGAATRGDEKVHDELLQRAVEENRRAFEAFEELGIRRGVATALSNLASTEEKLGHPRRALTEHQRALATRREVDDRVGVVNSLNHIGALHQELGDPDRAEEALLEARELGEEIGARVELDNVLTSLRELYSSRGDWQQAFTLAMDDWELDQQIASEKVEARIAELEAKYASEQRAREIELLTREREIARLEATRQRTLTRGSLIVAGLVALLLAVLFSRYRLNVRASRKLEEAVRTDALTGIPNRRAMIEAMGREASRSKRSGDPFSLLIVDLDDFKWINDEFGHDVGDQVLVAVAREMTSRLRSSDLLSRWGGEEFVVLLPDTGLDGALALAETIRESFAARSFLCGGRQIRLTVTIGAASFDGDEGLEACLRAADRALLEGKRAGKNRVLSLSA